MTGCAKKVYRKAGSVYRTIVIHVRRMQWRLQKPPPRIAGLVMARNEAAIIHDTLEHYAPLCTAGIYVFDDCSTDDTAAICRLHPAVVDVISGSEWSEDRKYAQSRNRQSLLVRALQDRPDWLLYFDADERLEVDLKGIPWGECDVIRCKLFDFHITAEDVDLRYDQRRWIGPEYRKIVMLYRNMDGIGYFHEYQRETCLPSHARVVDVGYVRHYGKAISVEEWEATCRYYSNFFSEPYRSKWLARIGRAVHTHSDFGRPLILWEERNTKGIELEE